MPDKISFVSACYVARQVDYNMTEGWMQGDKATNDYFEPIATYAQRFEEILLDVRAMGFDAIDIWLAHLHWRWATEEHMAVARELLSRYNLKVTSLAGGFGGTREEFEATCRLAQGVNTQILGGMTSLLAQDRAFVLDTLSEEPRRKRRGSSREKAPGGGSPQTPACHSSPPQAPGL